MKRLTLFLALVSGIILNSAASYAQCVQFINYPADTTGWITGPPNGGEFYNNDTFVVVTSQGGENNFIYYNLPFTLNGAASEFNASFYFRMDMSRECSDGLSFWFLTSGLSQLGNSNYNGCALGFPDTTIGFALAMQTTVCMDNIYLKKYNSDNYSFCGRSSSVGDTNICTPLQSQMFLTDGNWHYCSVNYDQGNITANFDSGNVVMTGYSLLFGTGYFGFMGTNGGGSTRKCLRDVRICAGYGTPTVASDSFAAYAYEACSSVQLEVHAFTYSPSYYVTVYYGDGSNISSVFSPDDAGSGYVILSHTYTYNFVNRYNIRAVLYNGSMAIDSLHFDYETPVCATPLTRQNDLMLYPNPAIDVLYLYTPWSTYTSYTINNCLGQLITQQAINAAQTEVSVANLPTGLYYVTFMGDSGTAVKKFVKM